MCIPMSVIGQIGGRTGARSSFPGVIILRWMLQELTRAGRYCPRGVID